MSLPLPLCAICGHPVDRVDEWHDLPNRCHHYRVYCHGEQQEFTVGDFFLMEFAREGIEMAPIEWPKKLLGP